MSVRRNWSAPAILVMGIIVGCAGKPKPQEETGGFLSTYKNLEQRNSTTLSWMSPEAVTYSKFIVDPVTVMFYDPATTAAVKQEDIDHFATYLHDRVCQALGAKYPLVNSNGAEVA